MVNPLQAALVTGAATTPGHALSRRYNEKMSKHGEGCRLAGLVFIPLPVETLGGMARADCCPGEEAGLCPGQAHWAGGE